MQGKARSRTEKMRTMPQNKFDLGGAVTVNGIFQFALPLSNGLLIAHATVAHFLFIYLSQIS